MPNAAVESRLPNLMRLDLFDELKKTCSLELQPYNGPSVESNDGFVRILGQTEIDIELDGIKDHLAFLVTRQLNVQVSLAVNSFTIGSTPAAMQTCDDQSYPLGDGYTDDDLDNSDDEPSWFVQTTTTEDASNTSPQVSSSLSAGLPVVRQASDFNLPDRRRRVSSNGCVFMLASRKPPKKDPTKKVKKKTSLIGGTGPSKKDPTKKVKKKENTGLGFSFLKLWRNKDPTKRVKKKNSASLL